MRYFSLFSGIGGFERGIDQAYVEITNRNKNGKSKDDQKTNAQKGKRLVTQTGKGAYSEERWDGELSHWRTDKRAPDCVGFSEIDKYAIQIYQKHFPNHKNYGDITKINAKELPDFDLLVGGFPCQSFSIAGKRRGFLDTRGTLFFEIARIAKEKRPRFLLLENVRGLLSHGNGNTFYTIISTLDELGYDCQWQVLNSKNFGVPQNRERVFIVGHLRGTTRPEVFPIIGENPITCHEVGTITAIKGNEHSKRCYSPKGLHPTLSTTMGGNTEKKFLFPGMKIRRLTPVECERLQGFPDEWTSGISDTRRYQTLGNAVTTNVIQAIMEKILCDDLH